MSDNNQNGNLNARSDVHVPTVYKDKLDHVLKDSNIKNIAITAPYDSGKTSFLKTYFKNREISYKWYIRGYNFAVRKINSVKEKFFFRPKLLSEIKDYEFINIPNFFETKDKESTNPDPKDPKNDSNDLEVQLEKNIIEQLLYKTNTKKYPDSNLKRLEKHSSFSIIMSFICLITIIAYLIRLFVKNPSLKWWNSLPIWNNSWFQIFSFLVVLIGSVRFFSLLVHSVGQMKLQANANAGSVELTGNLGEKDYQINLFNYYGDELQYYFQRNSIRIVIFEDLDRFNNPIIFQKLRGLNNNLNKAGLNIVFIYSVKDKIFALQESETSPAALRTKFFDIIIPIFPIHSYRDSRKVFVKERNKYEILSSRQDRKEKSEDYFSERDAELEEKESSNLKIDEKYLAGLGLYILDTREIINIISETNFYAAELPLKLLRSKNAMNKLLAMMVYKNVMPQDFDNLSSGKESQLATFIKDTQTLRMSWLDGKTNDNNKKIREIDERIKKISEKLTTDINLLMKIRLQELIDDNGGSQVKLGNVYYSSTDDISRIHEFWKECLANDLHYKSSYGYDHVADNLDKNEQEMFKTVIDSNEFTTNSVINNYRQRQNQLRKDNERFQKQSYQLGVGDLLKIYLDEGTQKIIPDEIKKIVNKDLKFIRDHHVMEYLIKQGLIGFDFADYISPDPYNLVGEDLFLVRSAVNRTNIEDENYRLLNVKGVMRELDLLDNTAVTYSYAYSPDILAALADENNTSRYQYLLALLNRVHEKKHYKFVLTAIEIKIPKPDEIKSILLGISQEWPTYYKEVFSLNDNDFQVEITRPLLICLEQNAYENLFQELSKGKIFENKSFEDELIVLDNKQLDKIFANTQDKYLYPDLSFAKGQSLLLKLIENQWYEKNSINFAIIFEQYFNNDFSKMMNNTDKAGFSNQYIKESIFDYYKKKQNAKYNDIIAISKFLNTNKSDNKTYLVPLIDVYLKTDVKFNNKEKADLIDKVNLIDLITNKKIEKDVLVQLIDEDKLIYEKSLFYALCKTGYLDASLEYALRYETPNNFTDFYYDMEWDFVMKYLSKSKYVVRLVGLIDKSNLSFSLSNCSNKAIHILIKNTQNIELVRHLLTFNDMSPELKDELIERIFEDSNLKAQFSKDEISGFYFNNPNYISSWPIGKNTSIPVSGYEKQIDRWTKIMAKYHLTSKRSKNIMLKSLDGYFK